jgi:hypothetical protein
MSVSDPPPPLARTARIPGGRRRGPETGDEHAPTRKWIAYGLIWLLVAIVIVSAIMLIITLYRGISDGPHFVLDWMGIALGPVSALAGSAVTFYMDRSRLN